MNERKGKKGVEKGDRYDDSSTKPELLMLPLLLPLGLFI